MAELATVARPYAEALFRVAKSGDMTAWSNLVSEMAHVGAQADVRALASDPNISNRQRVDILLALIKSDVSKEAKNLIEVLVENHRVPLLPEIGEQFSRIEKRGPGYCKCTDFQRV